MTEGGRNPARQEQANISWNQSYSFAGVGSYSSFEIWTKPVMPAGSIDNGKILQTFKIFFVFDLAVFPLRDDDLMPMNVVAVFGVEVKSEFCVGDVVADTAGM